MESQQNLQSNVSQSMNPVIVGGTATQEQALQLNFSLQASLSPEKILQRFFKYVSQTLDCASLSYEYDSSTLSIVLGQPESHCVEYDLILNDESLGQLILTYAQPLMSEEIDDLERLLSFLLYPLRNALYYQRAIALATQDMLTGAGNRVSFDKDILKEMEMAKRHDLPFSLLTVDIDYFKTINDEHGHGAGDRVLAEIVKTMQNVIRKSDRIYRIGGDEFHLILGATKLRGATILARRLCEAVAAKNFSDHVPVTISIGVATYANENRPDFCEKADRALYRAKMKGRNRIST